MRPFLKQVAELYKDRISTDSRSLCFVFPTRRASVFFRQYVSEQTDIPLFCPAMMTINELFARISSLHCTDRITLLFRLYKCYVEITGTSESFDEFVFWGDMLLADFNDVDKYLADPFQLFRNIADLNEIQDDFSYLEEPQRKAISDFWHSFFSSKEKLSEGKSRFKSMWASLYPLYRSFNDSLEKDGLAYEGMIYRKVAESLGHGDEILPEYERLVFVGLNALNECEKALLAHFRDEDRADFHWDYAGELLADKSNRAGLFMKDNLASFPQYSGLMAESRAEKLRVEVVQIPSAVGEAKYAGRILEEIGNESGRGTAVVLPDSRLLEPLVNSLPDCVRAVNVTMGYPLTSSSLASLMDSLKMMHLKARTRNGETVFYHKAVIEVLRHGSVSDMLRSREIIQNIFDSKSIYVRASDICGDELPGLFFRQVITDNDSASQEQTDRIADWQMDVLCRYGAVSAGMERDFAKSYLGAVQRLKDLRIPVRPATWFRLVDAILSGVSVPFRGEPLKGLQVMGPLETRALDFDNVIITSVNEGVFPSQNVGSSFIPYTLRKGFGLPTYEYQDAIWAYYFYRLLSRAKRVYLLCDTRVEGVSGSGESRFVKQLEYLYRDRIDFVRRPVSFESVFRELGEPQPVLKDDGLMQTLEDLFLGGKSDFSASTLNEYISCPLKFYFHKVKFETVEQELSDDLDYGTFGGLYHYVMQKLYEEHIGEVVSHGLLKKIMSEKTRIHSLISEAFEVFTGSRELRGQNLINSEVIFHMVMKTLERDSEIAPFTVIGTEKTLFRDFDLGDGRSVRIKGIVDRMDVRDGRLRVVDYKTGRVELSYQDISRIFDSSVVNRPYIILQLFIYQYLAEGVPSELKSLERYNVIYSTKSVFQKSPDEFAFTEDDYEAMERGVRNVILEILSRDVPFSKGVNAPCDTCDFISVCRRR